MRLTLPALALVLLSAAPPRDLAHKPVLGEAMCVKEALPALHANVEESVAIVRGEVELRLCSGARAPYKTGVGPGVFVTASGRAASLKWVGGLQAELARLRARNAELEAELVACRGP